MIIRATRLFIGQVALVGQSPFNHLVVFIAVLTLALITARIVLTLGHEGHLGIDPGAYLLHAKRLMGFPAPNIDFQRAPLGPGWLLVPFLHVWGDDVGTKIWTSVFSVFPLLPATALLAAAFLSRKQILVAVALLSLNPWNWEQVITGALPAIGIGLLFLVLWGLPRIMAGNGNHWDKLAVMGGVALIPYINHTSTGLASVGIPVFVSSYALITASWRPILRAAPWIALGASLAIPAVALFYGDVMFGGARMTYPGPKIFVPTGYSASWLLFFYSIPVVWGVLTHHPQPSIKALSLTLFTYASLGLFSSYDEAIINILYRSQYVASALLIILGVGYFAHELQGRIWAQRVVTISAMALLFVSVGFIWHTQPMYSDIYTPDFAKAAAEIPDAYDGSVLVNTFPMGMWIAAIDALPAVWLFQAEPPAQYTEEYRHSQCVLGWRDNCNPRESAGALGVQYILLNARPPFEREPNYWGAPPKERLWEPVEHAEWLKLVARYGDISLWQVQQRQF